MLKKIILTIILSHACMVVFSQFASLEELNNYKHQLSLVKDDSTRVLMMSYLSLHYGIWNPDSGAVYGQKALALAKQIKFKRGEARALIGLGRASIAQSDLPKSLGYAFQILRIAEENHYLPEKAMCYTENAFDLSQLEGGLKENSYYQQAELIFGTLGNDHDLDYWKVCQKMFSVRSLYYSSPNDSTLYLLEDLLEFTKNSEYWHPIILREFAEAQIQIGKHEAALNNLKQALDIVKHVKNHYQMAIGYMDLASVYRIIHKQDSSIYFAELSFAEAQLVGMRDIELSASKLLAEQYEPKDLKKALYYSKTHDSINETMYGGEKVKILQKTISQEQQRQRNKEAAQIAYQNSLKQYGFLTGLAISLLIAFLLYRNNRQKQKANTQLQATLKELKATQNQLIQSEKFASLGELTAGIAHEIQNPLNFVNNFSELSLGITKDLDAEITKKPMDEDYVKELMHDLNSNQEKINHHGKRAASIVKGMIEHSKPNTGVRELTDINKLCDEYSRLAYNSFQAKDKNFTCELITHFEALLPNIEVVPQDIGRVIVNLMNNAFYAVNERNNLLGAKLLLGLNSETSNLIGASHLIGSVDYKPTVTIITKKTDNIIEIHIKDNGTGMNQTVKAKIFQPFFTTKPTGSGTGLGLSLAYDIITKGHGGTLSVESTEGVGSAFVIILPL